MTDTPEALILVLLTLASGAGLAVFFALGWAVGSGRGPR
jgi:hypothetical protein